MINVRKAISDLPTKSCRKTKSSTYESYVSTRDGYKSLGTFGTEQEARSAAISFRTARFNEKILANGDIPESGVLYEQMYVVYPSGNIYNLHGEKIHGCIDKCGYREVILHGKMVLAHRIVAKVFIPNPNNYEQINHKNGCKYDNRVENLEWCTRSENLLHAYRTGLEQPRVGELHPGHKLTEDDVRNIRNEYKRGDREAGGGGLARKYKVDRSTIMSVIHNESWRSVNDKN